MAWLGGNGGVLGQRSQAIEGRCPVGAQAIEELLHVVEGFAAGLEVELASLAAARDQAGAFEHLEVAANSRESDRVGGGQLAHRGVAPRNTGHQVAAHGVGQGLQDSIGVVMSFNHGVERTPTGRGVNRYSTHPLNVSQGAGR